ncbi:MAG: translation initiation factor IF-3 [Candidatus Omnitrophica bacterium]|nr:translation initiation factor IF-3 [Candidatus Omnitrophota bacterium]MDD5351597.1 translation initiation factor IF-3 [Candidatus Omnitrophota bacterium]MDD5550806.1 translation initiation factor IF-3 [Candidatus Omnitrophota bacterium]
MPGARISVAQRLIRSYSPRKDGGATIKKFIRVNDKIRASSLRVIGPEGEQLGILSRSKGLELAGQNELDLVEVAPQAQPPVCRIMDFSKYKYEQEKKERQAKKHQTVIKIKEIRVKPNIEDHDYQTKLKQLHIFLDKGNKVKVNLFYRGREMSHRELGQRIIDRFIQDTHGAGKGIIEKSPAYEGRILSLVFAPNK